MSDRYCEFCTIFYGELQPCDDAGRCPRDPSHTIVSSLEGIVKEIKRRRNHAVRKAAGWAEVVQGLGALQTKLGCPVVTSWPTPCIDEFYRMAEQQPARLLEWIESGELAPSDLTYAASIVGDTFPAHGVAAVLVSMLQHKNAVVREGAALGLAKQLRVINKKLKDLTQTDPSDGVRATIRDIVGDEP